MDKNLTIVLTGGGTAGHVTPHMAVLPHITPVFSRIEYIGSYNGIEKTLVEQMKIPYHAVTTTKFVRKKIWQNFAIPFKLFKGTKEAKALLINIKPDVVFSKGGFVSVPVVRAACKLGIPIVAHESDLSVGLANKLNSKKCKVVFTSFEDTAKCLKNGVYCGSPLKENMKADKASTLKKFGLNSSLPVLLITGGSSGATAINKAVKEILPELTKGFQVVHLTGKGNTVDFNHRNYKQKEFEKDMSALLSITDFCVTRGGSNTIFELINCQIPMLIIPLPKGTSRGDQVENAKYFETRGAAHVLQQEDINCESFLKAIHKVVFDSNIIKANQKQYNTKDAAKVIASKLIAVAREK